MKTAKENQESDIDLFFPAQLLFLDNQLPDKGKIFWSYYIKFFLIVIKHMWH